MHCPTCDPRRLLYSRHCPLALPATNVFPNRIKTKLSTVPAATRGSDYVEYGVSTCGRHAASSKGLKMTYRNRVFHRTRSVNTNPLSATIDRDGRLIHHVRYGTSCRHTLLVVLSHSAFAALSSLPWQKGSTMYHEPFYV